MTAKHFHVLQICNSISELFKSENNFEQNIQVTTPTIYKPQTCGEVVQTGLAQLSAASQLTTPHAVFTSIFLVRSRDGVSANDISELIT